MELARVTRSEFTECSLARYLSAMLLLADSLPAGWFF
jgi:hypothetical protein